MPANLGSVGGGQVAGRLLSAALLISAGMIAGGVRGCRRLLQATTVADRRGTTGLGTLQGIFAAPRVRGCHVG
jgi:hypothetical protein